MADINQFHPATPILRTQNLRSGIDYYVKVLGFRLIWEDPGIIAAVARGDCHLMIVENDQSASRCWVWIGIQDTDALYLEFSKNGAKIRTKPTNYWWAYEMQVEDLDGNVLRFGAERKENEPDGPWLDADNRLWIKEQNGWIRKE